MRTVTIPAVSFCEEIFTLQEYPGDKVTPGHVNVEVRRCNEEGVFLPGASTSFQIEGDMYEMLVGDGQGWAQPDKPVGTYRNEDLWYFIDHIRAMNAVAA